MAEPRPPNTGVPSHSMPANQLRTEQCSTVDILQGGVVDNAIDNPQAVLTFLAKMNLLGDPPNAASYIYPRCQPLPVCKAIDLVMPSVAYIKQNALPCAMLAGNQGLCQIHAEQKRVFESVLVDEPEWAGQLPSKLQKHMFPALLLLKSLRFQNGLFPHGEALLFTRSLRDLWPVFRFSRNMISFATANDPLGTMPPSDISELFFRDLNQVMYHVMISDNGFTNTQQVTSVRGVVYTPEQTICHIYAVWSDLGLLPAWSIWQSVQKLKVAWSTPQVTDPAPLILTL